LLAGNLNNLKDFGIIFVKACRQYGYDDGDKSPYDSTSYSNTCWNDSSIQTIYCSRIFSAGTVNFDTKLAFINMVMHKSYSKWAMTSLA